MWQARCLMLQIFINNRAGMGKIFEKKEEKREKVEMPLALRGHVTNASFKQRVGILLMPKIDKAHKNYLTPEI